MSFPRGAVVRWSVMQYLVSFLVASHCGKRSSFFALIVLWLSRGYQCSMSLPRGAVVGWYVMVIFFLLK